MKMIDREQDYGEDGGSDDYGIEAAKAAMMNSLDPSSIRSPLDIEYKRKHIHMDDNRLSLMV